ncbi:Hypothetical_protein [Hexamita inflata]|uniref:Hypothetical_protein n=1 Tax=Hexamita inflata TaxID=28002 RepID=A0AA86PDD0_9EUKA|nr:Hypothetical protein HINF_LOCUS24148 [Hexamita inflata]
MLSDYSFVPIENIRIDHMYFKLVISGEHDYNSINPCQFELIPIRNKRIFTKQQDELILDYTCITQTCFTFRRTDLEFVHERVHFEKYFVVALTNVAKMMLNIPRQMIIIQNTI